MSNIDLQPFDEMDWQAYAGAEGENPLIAYLDKNKGEFIVLDDKQWNAVVILDENGTHIDFIDDNEQIQFTWQRESNQREAKFLVEHKLDFTKLITKTLLALNFYVA